jgi:hypothetical protein
MAAMLAALSVAASGMRRHLETFSQMDAWEAATGGKNLL